MKATCRPLSRADLEEDNEEDPRRRYRRRSAHRARRIAPANAADGPAQLSVLHGVPGLTVDVYVNGELTLDDFEPGDLAGPLELAAGTYTVAITAADAADASAPAIGPVDLPLEGGKNYTAVAHLSEAGEPTATLFTNDIAQTAAGQGRLTVRHVAAAPAVDVLAGGTAVITNLTNPNEQVLNLAAGTVEASVAATGTTDPVIGPARGRRRGREHHRLRLGQPRGRQPRPRRADHHRPALDPGRRAGGHGGSRGDQRSRQRGGHLGGDRRGDPRRSRARLRGMRRRNAAEAEH